MPLTTVHPIGARGVDYSYGRPNYALLAGLGYRFAVRYQHPNRRHAKVLQAAERDELHGHGMGILLVWEINEARPLAGAQAGADDGRQACERAYELGYPPALPILCAFDTNIDPRLYPREAGQARSYGHAFADAATPYGFGVYGDTDVIEMFRGVSVLNWLPNASSWSTPASAAQQLVHVRQGRQQTIAGCVCDPNTVVRPINSWLPTADPAPSVPFPPTIQPGRLSAAVLDEGDPDMKWSVCARTLDGTRPDGPERWPTNGIVRVVLTEAQIQGAISRGDLVGTLAAPARLYGPGELPPIIG